MTQRPIPPTVVYEPRIKDPNTRGVDPAALRAAADGGDTWSQGRLAYVLHEQGQAHFEEAEHWVRKAAEAGDVQAQALLGEWLRSGYGAPQDLVEALRWIQAAAEACYPGAEYDMGDIYFFGMAVQPDRDLSRYWYARSTVHGHPNAEWRARVLLDRTLFDRFMDLAEKGYQVLARRVLIWAKTR